MHIKHYICMQTIHLVLYGKHHALSHIIKLRNLKGIDVKCYGVCLKVVILSKGRLVISHVLSEISILHLACFVGV